MIITKIEKTKKGRYSLFINGEFAFSITGEQLYVEGLKIDQNITEEKLYKVRSESERFFARDRAMLLLSRRSYTRYQMEEKLKKVAGMEIISEICDRMEEVGLINDEDYAIRRAADLYNIKKYGKYRVFQDLKNRGIDESFAEQISCELAPEDSVTVICSVITKKYSKKLYEIVDAKSYHKNAGSVQNSIVRLGYDFSEARAAIIRFLEENEIKYR